jgi:hypothetical protein
VTKVAAIEERRRKIGVPNRVKASPMRRHWLSLLLAVALGYFSLAAAPVLARLAEQPQVIAAG